MGVVVVIEFKEDRELWREVPVRLRLGDQDLLGWEDDPYRPLPLVLTAFWGLIVLR
jgi:hypothetical protein